MKSGKAVGLDGIPAKAWRALGDEGTDVLWLLMKKVMYSERITEKWRESILILIFTEKDVQL